MLTDASSGVAKLNVASSELPLVVPLQTLNQELALRLTHMCVLIAEMENKRIDPIGDSSGLHARSRRVEGRRRRVEGQHLQCEAVKEL